VEKFVSKVLNESPKLVKFRFTNVNVNHFDLTSDKPTLKAFTIKHLPPTWRANEFFVHFPNLARFKVLEEGDDSFWTGESSLLPSTLVEIVWPAPTEQIVRYLVKVGNVQQIEKLTFTNVSSTIDYPLEVLWSSLSPNLTTLSFFWEGAPDLDKFQQLVQQLPITLKALRIGKSASLENLKATHEAEIRQLLTTLKDRLTDLEILLIQNIYFTGVKCRDVLNEFVKLRKARFRSWEEFHIWPTVFDAWYWDRNDATTVVGDDDCLRTVRRDTQSNWHEILLAYF
jgi:hypothetical protein